MHTRHRRGGRISTKTKARRYVPHRLLRGLSVLWLAMLLAAAGCYTDAALPPEAEQFNQYQQPPELTKSEVKLAANISVWAREVQREPPILDAGLAYAARSLALRMKQAGSRNPTDVNNSDINEELLRYGVSDSAVRTQVQVGPQTGKVEDELRRTVREELKRGHYTHFGVGVMHSLFPPLVYAGLILSRRPVMFDPFPKWLPPGERLELTGRLLEGLNQPAVYFSPPSGQVNETFLEITGDGSFRTNLFFGRGPGLYRIEIAGHGSLGPEIAALMPVQVGDAPPPVAPTPLVKELDEESARQLVFLQINRERVEAGLPPLQLHAGLGRVAQAHAEDMRGLGYAAHRSPTTGMASDRATAAGIHWIRIGENVAVNQTALAAHTSLMESPAHRLNVLEPHMQFVGIGVAFAGEGNSQETVYLVENYIAISSP